MKLIAIVPVALIVLMTSFNHVFAGGTWMEMKPGCQGWNAYPSPDETAKWTGECKNGKISGKGKLIFRGWLDGKRRKVVIFGTANNGKISGEAKKRFWDGTWFRGVMKATKLVSGRLTMKNGDWFDGSMSGDGSDGRGICNLGGKKAQCVLKNYQLEFK